MVSLTICSSVGWASAADSGYSGTAQLNTATGTALTSTFADSFSIPTSSYNRYHDANTFSDGIVGFSSLVVTHSDGGFTSAVGLYFSYYFRVDSSVHLVEYGNPSTAYFKVGGLETSTTSFTYTPVSNVYTFTPAAAKSSEGVSIVGRALATEADPLKNVGLFAVGADGTIGKPQSYISIGDAWSYTFCVTNARIVGTTSSAELDALEDMASAIAEQNDILQAMYGDLVAICNSIYQRTGDLLQAQQLTNQYFSQVIPLLNSLKNTTADIYALLQAQFNLLISTIETASTDIQGAISAQTAALIAYLDSVFQAGVNPDTAQRTEDIETGLGSLNDGESTYTSAATERYEALTANFSGFEGDTLSGVALVSNLFKQVWDAFGDYNIVYIFPLTFGLSLVFLGRLSRFHQHEAIRDSRRSRSEGGKSKGKDG